MKQLIPIQDTHPIKLIWDVFLLVVILFSSITIPYRLTLGYEQLDFSYWLITAVFVVDILVHFNTVIRQGDGFITDRKKIATVYLKSGFFVDLIAAIPFAVLEKGTLAQGLIGSILVGLQLLRLLKLSRFNKTLQHLQDVFFFNPAITRLIVFFFWSVLLVHFISLGWIFIGGGDQDGTEAHRYLMALYWAVSTTSTIGYGDITPDRSQHIQVIYAMCVQLIGVTMLGYIVGNIASILTSMDVAKANFLQKMEDINSFFRAHSVPQSIQNRARDYYRYLWDTRRSVEREDTVVSEMPDSLRMDVLLFLHREVVQKVTMFQNISEEFTRHVVELLETEVFLPGDYIIRQGEFGDCMYFLLNGEVQVIVNGQTVAQLISGSPFGEAALLNEERRNASVQAIGYCDVYKLSKKKFGLLRDRFPEFDARVKEIVAIRTKDTQAKTQAGT